MLEVEMLSYEFVDTDFIEDSYSIVKGSSENLVPLLGATLLTGGSIVALNRVGKMINRFRKNGDYDAAKAAQRENNDLFDKIAEDRGFF